MGVPRPWALHDAKARPQQAACSSRSIGSFLFFNAGQICCAGRIWARTPSLMLYGALWRSRQAFLHNPVARSTTRALAPPVRPSAPTPCRSCGTFFIGISVGKDSGPFARISESGSLPCGSATRRTLKPVPMHTSAARRAAFSPAVFLGERGTLRGDRVREAACLTADYVDLAFAQNGRM